MFGVFFVCLSESCRSHVGNADWRVEKNNNCAWAFDVTISLQNPASLITFLLVFSLLFFFFSSFSSVVNYAWCSTSFSHLGCVDQTIFTEGEKSLMGCSMSVCTNSSLVKRKRGIDGWRMGGGTTTNRQTDGSISLPPCLSAVTGTRPPAWRH